MTSSFDMSSLQASINESVYLLLKKDVLQIINIFNYDCNYELDPTEFCMKRGIYIDSQCMYKDILKIIYNEGYGADHLDLMPYIDDFLSFYF